MSAECAEQSEHRSLLLARLNSACRDIVRARVLNFSTLFVSATRVSALPARDMNVDSRTTPIDPCEYPV